MFLTRFFCNHILWMFFFFEQEKNGKNHKQQTHKMGLNGTVRNFECSRVKFDSLFESYYKHFICSDSGKKESESTLCAQNKIKMRMRVFATRKNSIFHRLNAPIGTFPNIRSCFSAFVGFITLKLSKEEEIKGNKILLIFSVLVVIAKEINKWHERFKFSTMIFFAYFARCNELNTHFGWEFEQCPPPRANIHARKKIHKKCANFNTESRSKRTFFVFFSSPSVFTVQDFISFTNTV